MKIFECHPPLQPAFSALPNMLLLISTFYVIFFFPDRLPLLFTYILVLRVLFMRVPFIASAIAIIPWPFSTYWLRVLSFLCCIRLPSPVSLVPSLWFLFLPVPVLRHSLECQLRLPVSSYDCVTTYYLINKLNLANPSHLI